MCKYDEQLDEEHRIRAEMDKEKEISDKKAQAEDEKNNCNTNKKLKQRIVENSRSVQNQFDGQRLQQLSGRIDILAIVFIFVGNFHGSGNE